MPLDPNRPVAISIGRTLRDEIASVPDWTPSRIFTPWQM